MVAHAGGAEVAAVAGLDSSELSQPEAGEVPVVDWYLCCRVLLRVRADVASPGLAG